MRYYPVFLDVCEKKCLVIGGGPVGARKTRTLEKCGARVEVVSDRFCDAFNGMDKAMTTLNHKPFEPRDIDGCFLVIAATGNAQINAFIQREAQKRGVMCNIADNPDKSSFILPAVIEQGDLILAISTSGASPAVARKIKQKLESQFGPEYGRLLVLMRAVRNRLLKQGHDPDSHRESFYSLLENGILKAIESEDEEQINTVLNMVLGDGYTYENLVAQGAVNEPSNG